MEEATVPNKTWEDIVSSFMLFKSPHEKRINEYFHTINEIVAELQGKKIINPTDLANDDLWISSVKKLFEIWIVSHEKEKLHALKCIMYNITGSKLRPDDSVVHIFISHVRELSVHHMFMLKLFYDAEKWFSDRGMKFPNVMSGEQLLKAANPELYNNVIWKQLWKDLYAKGLTSTDTLGGTVSKASGKYLSKLGIEFFNFIDNSSKKE